jgi:hypothetical protein
MQKIFEATYQNYHAAWNIGEIPLWESSGLLLLISAVDTSAGRFD